MARKFLFRKNDSQPSGKMLIRPYLGQRQRNPACQSQGLELISFFKAACVLAVNNAKKCKILSNYCLPSIKESFLQVRNRHPIERTGEMRD
jgi:hypothetical protein